MRLLLAEDELALSKALKAILERNKYSVDAVYDGQEALDYLHAGNNYDGVILDIMMPKIDGIAVLKEIRAQGNLIPVILLTAKSEIDDKVLGLDAGANDYLTKPFPMHRRLPRRERPADFSKIIGISHMRQAQRPTLFSWIMAERCPRSGAFYTPAPVSRWAVRWRYFSCCCSSPEPSSNRSRKPIKSKNNSSRTPDMN